MSVLSNNLFVFFVFGGGGSHLACLFYLGCLLHWWEFWRLLALPFSLALFDADSVTTVTTEVGSCSVVMALLDRCEMRDEICV